MLLFYNYYTVFVFDYILSNANYTNFIIKNGKSFITLSINHSKQNVILHYNVEDDVEGISHILLKLSRLSGLSIKDYKIIYINDTSDNDILSVIHFMMCERYTVVENIDPYQIGIIMKVCITKYIKDKTNFVNYLKSEYVDYITPLTIDSVLKDKYIKIVNSIIKSLNNNSMLNTSTFVFLLHSLNYENSNVIEPLLFILKKWNKKINTTGKYFYPVCHEYHWTLWEIDYIHHYSINYTIYDSLSSLSDNSIKIIKNKISEIFDMNNIMYENINNEFNIPKQGKDNSCGYFVLFYLLSRIKNKKIEDIPFINYFNVVDFIDDLKILLYSLSDEEKCRIYLNNSLLKI